MNKYFRPRSLSAQLFFGVQLSLLAAVITFISFFSLGNHLLDRTIYGEPFMGKMADRYFSSLQDYVNQEKLTEKNLTHLHVWCSRGDKVYLTIYTDGRLLYESPFTYGRTPDQEEYEPIFEDTAQEYSLTLSDGAVVQAFLYYYAGDAYFYWVIVVSGLISFLVFSMCFIALVHRKLRYVKLLKEELDILAGGDLSYQVTVKGEDELGELASGIDKMRRSILTHQNAEEQMRSANSQLVTAMSHDLRTPLTSLLAYLELIDRGKYDSDEQLHHFISRSLAQTLRIRSMANKLFEYFLVYSSEQERAELETEDAGEIIQQFWGEYAFSLENKGFRVCLNLGQLSGSLHVNIDLLRRAFDNLYSNLLKYADPSYPVLILCRQSDQQLKLTLINHISPERDTCESTNIGLSTCRRILQYHGGSFEAKEDYGIFTAKVTLPLSEPEN